MSILLKWVSTKDLRRIILKLFLTRLVKLEIAHFLWRSAFLKTLSENSLNNLQDSGVKFLPLTLTLSRRGRGDPPNFSSLDGRGQRGG